jgi:hypothetical protein
MGNDRAKVIRYLIERTYSNKRDAPLADNADVPDRFAERGIVICAGGAGDDWDAGHGRW